MNTLQDYITDFQRLVHDSTYNFWSQAEIISYINKARKITAAETLCIRSLQTINITAATTLAMATYDLSTIVANRRVIDILDILVQFSSNSQYPLIYQPFDVIKRLPAWQYQSPGQPRWYTVYNNQLVYILPWPAVAYSNSLFECVFEATDLVNTTDDDTEILSPYTECVGFYTAYLAKIKDQRRDQAEEFLADYTRMKMRAIGTTFSRRLIGK